MALFFAGSLLKSFFVGKTLENLTRARKRRSDVATALGGVLYADFAADFSADLRTLLPTYGAERTRIFDDRVLLP